MDNTNNKIDKELLELTLEQVVSIDQELFDGKAGDYYGSCQIVDATVFQNKLSGRVGNYFENFDVQLTLREDELSGTCTCTNERKICQHAIALLYGWINDSQDFQDVAILLSEIKEFSRDELLQIVSNIIKRYPHLVEEFTKDDLPDWDEIDEYPIG